MASHCSPGLTAERSAANCLVRSGLPAVPGSLTGPSTSPASTIHALPSGRAWMYRTWLHGTTRVPNIPRRRSPASSAQVTLRRLLAANHPPTMRPAPWRYHHAPRFAHPMASPTISNTPEAIKMTANTAVPTAPERVIRYSRAFTPRERAGGTDGFPGA
jgi:hypothetical protein